ncbi:ABC transporter permease [Pseudomonas typographi]|uniref:ABC transporter permease n=1 Tax=Pseudomonas typographi TaxID=2715964 RepID=A0ABR7Z1V9_9PSED|nr:ABC transporter permease [Pseudomonas typographi]MBD1551481.1 ABC transporter permease [Pseudomonas typographi]MBD1599384.1 ABC transporter permease [Pseudomonas typographi]
MHIKRYIAPTFLAAVVFVAVFAPWLPLFDRDAIDLASALQPPSANHWFGTDNLGRDTFTRVVYGSRTSLSIVVAAVGAGGGLGCLLGLLAGYRGGWFDAIIMRAADLQYSLPPVILALVATVALGTGMANLVIAISLATWPRFARIVRAEALHLRQRDFVLLAELGGASVARVLLQHLLPNMLNTVMVLATLDIGLVVTLEATLSFLGLGVQPPDPSWGTMIADGRAYLSQAWWLTALPGAILVATILAVNTTSHLLRQRQDERMEVAFV